MPYEIYGTCVVVRRAGGGLAALSKPIQDLFDQIFAMGHVSKEDVPDSIYDSLQGFEGALMDVVVLCVFPDADSGAQIGGGEGELRTAPTHTRFIEVYALRDHALF